MNSNREKIVFWSRLSLMLVLMPFVIEGIITLPQYTYSTNELVLTVLCGIISLFCIFRTVLIGKVFLTLELGIIVFLMTYSSNHMLPLLLLLLISLIQQIFNYMKNKSMDLAYFVYRTMLQPVTLLLAYKVMIELLGRGLWTDSANNSRLTGAILVLYFSVVISVLVELLDVYIERKQNMFLVVDIYKSAIKGATLLAILAGALSFLYPIIGNVGIAILFVVLAAILQFSKIHKDQQRLQEIGNNILKASDALSAGGFGAKAESLLNELASTFESTMFALYLFDRTLDFQLPKIISLYHMDRKHELDYFNYGFHLAQSEEFLGNLGVTVGEVQVCKSLESSGLKFEGMGFDAHKGLMATPIIGPDGVEGMLLMMAEYLFIERRLRKKLISAAGSLLSEKFMNDMLNRKAMENSNLDKLTGLFNRNVFDTVIASYIESSMKFALALFDIDDFNHLNETYGAVHGDLVLKKVSAIIRQNTKAADYCFRYGEDQLCIIFNDPDLDKAYQTADRVRAMIEAMNYESECGVTASAGVVVFPENGKTALKIVYEADRLIRTECKQTGKNKVAKALGLNINKVCQGY